MSRISTAWGNAYDGSVTIARTDGPVAGVARGDEIGRAVRGVGEVGGAVSGVDEVDEITAAWRRELPEVDVSPLQVLSRIMRLARRLDRERREAFSAHLSENWEFDVLSALRRAGAPYAMSAGQLGVATGVTSGTMTNRIDRLEERGLVRRAPDPQDRRGVRVVLTQSGRRAVDDALVDLMEREHSLLAHLSPDQQRDLADLLRSFSA